MGKAVPKGLKSRAAVLLESFPEKFTLDFEKNKLVLAELQMPFFKKDRNVIAGFITRKVRQKTEAA